MVDGEKIVKYDYLAAFGSNDNSFKTFSLAKRGQVILTTSRLVFINFGIAKTMFGINAGKKYATESQLPRGLAREGSFYIPLDEIVEIKSGGQNLLTSPTITIKRQSGSETKWYRFVDNLGSPLNRMNANEWEIMINSLKSRLPNPPVVLPNISTTGIQQTTDKDAPVANIANEPAQNASEIARQNREQFEKATQLNNDMQKIRTDINQMERQIEGLKKEQQKKTKLNGESGYPILRELNMFPLLHESVDHIKFVEREISLLEKQIVELKEQNPQGSLISRLKDKAVNAGKTVKHELDKYNLNRKKDQLIIDFGKELYLAYLEKKDIPAELIPICKQINEIDSQINDITNNIESKRVQLEEIKKEYELIRSK